MLKAVMCPLVATAVGIAPRACESVAPQSER